VIGYLTPVSACPYPAALPLLGYATITVPVYRTNDDLFVCDERYGWAVSWRYQNDVMRAVLGWYFMSKLP